MHILLFWSSWKISYFALVIKWVFWYRCGDHRRYGVLANVRFQVELTGRHLQMRPYLSSLAEEWRGGSSQVRAYTVCLCRSSSVGVTII